MDSPFVFRSLVSMPYSTKLFLLPAWPFCFFMMLVMWVKSKTYLVSFYNLIGGLHQPWIVPRFGFQNEALNGGGTLFVHKHENLKVRMVHGNTLTAAVILNENFKEVFLTGATFQKKSMDSWEGDNTKRAELGTGRDSFSLMLMIILYANLHQNLLTSMMPFFYIFGKSTARPLKDRLGKKLKLGMSLLKPWDT